MTYRFKVTLEVSVDAPSDFDALEIIQDTFGPGDYLGVNVESTNCEPRLTSRSK